jgi:hypothetical protein
MVEVFSFCSTSCVSIPAASRSRGQTLIAVSIRFKEPGRRIDSTDDDIILFPSCEKYFVQVSVAAFSAIFKRRQILPEYLNRNKEKKRGFSRLLLS